MLKRFRFSLFSVISCLALAAFSPASEIDGQRSPSAFVANHGVVSLVGAIPEGTGYGTGICLDTPCRNVLTNYHVAGLMTAGIQVEGVSADYVKHFSGPYEQEAIEVRTGFGVLRYVPSKDLSLVTLVKPLSPSYSGVRFSRTLPQVGEEVTRSTRYKKTYETSLGKVVADDLTLLNGVKLPGNYLLDIPSHHGNSGGAILNRSGEVVGVISMAQVGDAAQAEKADTTHAIGTVVIGTALVSQFLKNTNRELWSTLFPWETSQLTSAKVEPDAFDTTTIAYNAYSEPVVRSADSSQYVSRMMKKAAENKAAMSKVFANQSVKAWGSDTKEWSRKFQVALYADGVKYRRFTKKGLSPEQANDYHAGPKVGIRPGDEWLELLQMLEHVHVQYQGSSNYFGETVHVFHYSANQQDKACSVGEVKGSEVSFQYVPCQGVILTDNGFNMVLINRQADTESGLVRSMKTVVVYGPVNLQGQIRVLPVKTELVAQFRPAGKTYHATEEWNDYHLFQAESTLFVTDSVLITENTANK